MDELDKGGRPPYKPTDKDRRTVKIMHAAGFNHEKISCALKKKKKTLRKHFKQELKGYSGYLDQMAAKSLATHLRRKDKAMTMFYLKTRCGWKESIDLLVYNPLPAISSIKLDEEGNVIQGESGEIRPSSLVGW